MVRHGLNHSRPAVSVPIRASMPSDTTSSSLHAKNDGNSALYVCSCCQAVQIVASSSAGFFSSMTPSGRPFKNSTTSARRVLWPSVTVNWFTASQSLASASSKSITRACAPRIVPSEVRYSTVTPSTSIRWKARFLVSHCRALRRVNLRKASSSTSAGRSGLSRPSASRSRCASMISP